MLINLGNFRFFNFLTSFSDPFTTLTSVEKKNDAEDFFNIFSTRKKLTGSEVRDDLEAFSFVIWIRKTIYIFFFLEITLFSILLLAMTTVGEKFCAT